MFTTGSKRGHPALERTKALNIPLASEVAVRPLRKPRRPKSQAAPPLASLIAAALDDAKAEGVVTLDLNGKSTLADIMVVATGRSNVHVGSIAERVLAACKGATPTLRCEGMPHNDWVLIDAGDVIVHIFRPEVRQFYNLEKIWGGSRPAEDQADEGQAN